MIATSLALAPLCVFTLALICNASTRSRLRNLRGTGLQVDNTIFGFSHLRDFEKISVVSDVGWIRNSVAMFAHFAPMQLRLFAVDQTDAAFGWLTDDT